MKKKNRIKIGAIILLIVTFIINTILVVTKNTVAIDNFVHDSIRLMHGNIVDKVMKVITFFGGIEFIIILAVIITGYYFYKKNKNKSYIVMGTLVISTIINTIIKLLVKRARPLYITVVENSYSYPSGHTMASATLYGTIIYLILKSNLKKSLKIIYSILLIILIILVGISRIYLGAHFFTDVFGSILLSSALILILSIVVDKRKLFNKD